MNIEQTIETLRIVPVVSLENAKHAVPLGQALKKASLPIAEITFRTDAAAQAIENLAQNLPDLLIGAGTVLTIDQVNQATEAGAKFIVSPGFNPKIVDYCLNRNIPIFPGINSPTGVEQGLERGLKVLKFFPAEASGGIPMIRALSAPYPGIRFMPTGGVHSGNISDYLSLPSVIACGGSWMVKPELIHKEKFDEITRLSNIAVQSVKAP